MSNEGKWLNGIGRVIKSPKTGRYFLIFERRKDKNKNYVGENPFPMVINEGDSFQLKLKKDDLANLVKRGTITQEQSDKICEVVKFEVSKAPPKENEPNSKSSARQSDDDEEIQF